MTASSIVDTLAKLFEDHGADWYMGESVTIAQHMLQSAWFASEARAPDEEIVAALLHDIGHYTGGLPETALQQGDNNYHENVGADFLARYFSEAVTEPIRLHVDAKRYLCAVNDNYHKHLSEASVRSMAVQGGAMSKAQCVRFEENAHYQSATRLRYRDDAGKDPALEVPDFNSYRTMLEGLIEND
jgi:phosphonate degradation associated HDIG domain protein